LWDVSRRKKGILLLIVWTFAYHPRNQRKALFIKVFTKPEDDFSQTQQIYTLPANIKKVCYSIQK
jgi:hypothetical protein